MHTQLSRRERWGRAFKQLAIGLAIAVTALVAWQGWLHTVGVYSTARFDQQAWLTQPSRDEQFGCWRGGMAADLRDRMLPIGLPREQVQALLGTPADSQSDRDDYALGYCSPLRMDIDTLIVTYDAQSRVVGVGIAQR